ncbi:MAG: tetratricopeptide repeat protein [Haliscomenobacter sp.]|nr:tetratricopeptide repeat protein [Haliscomenobacter sp.]MBK9488261.1 tetratricopeptide repeat protein [Haliscomenobacter sp.]
MYEQSLIIWQQIGDRQREGVTLNNISQIYDAKGDYDTALRFLEQSLAIRQQIGDRKGEGVTLNNISQIYYAKGDYDTALRFWNKVSP